MKKIIIALAFVIVAVFLANTFITGETNSLRSESQSILSSMLSQLRDLDRD